MIFIKLKRKSLGQTSVTEQETELERLESKPVGAENMESRLPRKQSVVWIAMKKVKTKLSLTEEGATPVNWKVIFLVFVSLVSLFYFVNKIKCLKMESVHVQI